MKRELLCLNCGVNYKKVMCSQDFKGEHVKFMAGRLINDCVCDCCNVKIEPLKHATCFTVWSDISGSPYHPWESEYILTKEK